MRRVMLQRVHSHDAVEPLHAPVPADGCAGVVAASAARGVVGHDLQANAPAHEVETSGDSAVAVRERTLGQCK